MICTISLVDATERLSVSTTVRAGEATWATVRFHVMGEPAEVSLHTPDTAGLIHLLLRAAQQLCDKTVAAGVTLPGEGWGRASLLLDDALAAISDTSHDDTAGV
ncbi:MAG: hypothetical protein ACRDZ4_13840 [Egibacteraceae bacterium]